MALIVAGLLTLVVFALAFVVDLSYAFTVKSQLQNAADAAGHAAVAELDGTRDGLDAARSAAVRWAAANEAAGERVAVDPLDDVRLGYWDEGSDAFVESDDPLRVDTVVVTARGRAPGFFAPIAFGVIELSAAARTTVQGGGVGRVGCYLPLAVPSCLVEHNVGGICDVTLTFAPVSDKNAAWARIDETGRPNAAWLREQLDSCVDEEASVGDGMFLDNGVVTPALRTIAERIETSSYQWAPRWGTRPAQLDGSAVSAEAYGRVVSGPVAVFESDTCAGSPFTRSTTVIGFAQAAIYDVRVGANPTIRAKIVCGEEVGTVAGGIAGTGYLAAPRFRQ
ncbi:MAG: pilus assembly protein TadG-related protein [Myxococcota bacterium]